MPTYNARFEKYITNQGEVWDMIALKCYGDEHAMDKMQEANYEHRYVDVFPGNIELVVPLTVVVENNLKSPVKTPNIKGLLPWR
jgi:hypothetical protein